LLASQYRSLTHVKLLRGAGKPLGEIERELSMNHYAATRVAAQASRMQADALQARYRACVEADYAIKSGAARDEAAFETLLII
jgi:DNA polymerase III delta subunit